MLFWTFTAHASVCCMLSWIGACQQGTVLALSFGGGRRRSAAILPFPSSRATGAGPAPAGGIGSATIIPLRRRPSHANMQAR